MIQFSLSPFYNNVLKRKQYRVMSQQRGKISLEEFAEHIAQHNCPYDKGTIMGVLTTSVDCLREKLLQGYSVTWGDLGTFSVALKSNSPENRLEFTVKDITEVNLRLNPGPKFKNMVADAEFRQVPTVLTAAAFHNAAKQGVSAEELAERVQAQDQDSESQD